MPNKFQNQDVIPDEQPVAEEDFTSSMNLNSPDSGQGPQEFKLDEGSARMGEKSDNLRGKVGLVWQQLKAKKLHYVIPLVVAAPLAFFGYQSYFARPTVSNVANFPPRAVLPPPQNMPEDSAPPSVAPIPVNEVANAAPPPPEVDSMPPPPAFVPPPSMAPPRRVVAKVPPPGAPKVMPPARLVVKVPPKAASSKAKLAAPKKWVGKKTALKAPKKTKTKASAKRGIASKTTKGKAKAKAKK